MGKSNYQREIKFFVIIFLFLTVFANLYVSSAVALAEEKKGIQQAFDTGKGSPLQVAAEDGVGFNPRATFNTITGIIISSVLSIMGALFLVLAIYAGYKWMMARGNEEEVTKAKETLTNAIIGLVIVLGAYAISYFVLSQLSPTTLKDVPSATQSK